MWTWKDSPQIAADLLTLLRALKIEFHYYGIKNTEALLKTLHQDSPLEIKNSHNKVLVCEFECTFPNWTEEPTPGTSDPKKTEEGFVEEYVDATNNLLHPKKDFFNKDGSGSGNFSLVSDLLSGAVHIPGLCIGTIRMYVVFN